MKEIEALGLELDTDHHEAVARFDAGKEKKGKIVDVVQPGYKWATRCCVLRKWSSESNGRFRLTGAELLRRALLCRA